MKRGVLFMMAVVLAIGGGATPHYDPHRDGAQADLLIRVLDELGMPVANVAVKVSFALGPMDGTDISGTTNSEGYFGAKHETTGSIWIVAEKDGYYRTRLHIDAQKLPYDSVTRTQAWSTGPDEIAVLLKTIRNPVRLAFHREHYKPFPATNKVLKFDLELTDWCPPYGTGVHDDIHLLFDSWKNPEEWAEFHHNLLIVFPREGDGFYAVDIDSANAASRFPYVYRADSGHELSKKLELRFARTPTEINERVALDPNVYLIYRIRSVRDAEGNILHAHYGRIEEGLSQLIGLTIGNWFNPNDNDTNLECTSGVGGAQLH